MLATTADIRDKDFLAGIYDFSGAGTGSIVNQGRLTAAVGGYIGLAAARVDNQGLIEANLGTVALAAGSAYTVDFVGDKLLSFEVKAPAKQDAAQDPLISNSGKISATGGQVSMTARAARDVLDNVINTSGIVVATHMFPRMAGTSSSMAAMRVRSPYRARWTLPAKGPARPAAR